MRKGDFKILVTANGSIIPIDRVEIKSKASGLVEELREGFSTFGLLLLPVAIVSGKNTLGCHPDGRPIRSLTCTRQCFEAAVKYIES